MSKETSCIPYAGLTSDGKGICVYVHTSLSPATNTMGHYLGSICSWFTEEECQGLSVPLWYAQIRAFGPLFKHLGPGVLEHPPSPFATKGEEMEERVQASAAAAEGNVCEKHWIHDCMHVLRLMQAWLFPHYLPQYFINKKENMSKNRKWRQGFIDLCHSPSCCPVKNSRLYYEKTEWKHWWFSVMFNSYMSGKHAVKIGSFFTYVMYITARVSHLHENGQISERDKPKASSRELDAVFGIPSRRGLFFPFPHLCRISPLHHVFIFPIIIHSPFLCWLFSSVQGLLKYCCNPVSLKPQQCSPWASFKK